MNLRPGRILWLFLAGLLLAACGPLGAQPTPEDIVAQMQTALENMKSAHAVIEVNATHDGKTIRLLTESWFRRDGEREQIRSEVREASEPDVVRTLAVSDGETGWIYNPAAGKVLTGDRASLEAWRAEEGGAAAEMPTDLSSVQALTERALEISDVTLVGEETVADRPVWHVRFTPNEQAPQALQAARIVGDLWIDKANDLPLQASYTGEAEVAGEARVTVQELDQNEPVAPERFQWTPPAGVEVVNIEKLLPQRMTLPEAQAEAPFHLLSTPGDSPEATLVELFRQGDHYIQKFDGLKGQWTLAQGPAGDPGDHSRTGEGATAVTVRGIQGHLWSDPNSGHTILSWIEDDIVRTITGRLSPEATQAIAEALR
ncbi:MAG TPA: hypothetical protein DEP84_26235 [Chloroflexi bacterium]|nr:hypothetical protein [Chloroflexota bacterium]